MGGSGIDDDWDLADSTNFIRTLVLLGKAGNGKSATGNSILGRKAFKSGFGTSGVTSTCQLASTTAEDNRIINVIDTPGLFDFSVGSEFIGSEIVKCIDLAKEGIHAVLLVFSVRSRFTKEEEATLQSLKSFFGDRIINYMIVVFTGGDDLEDDEMSLNEFFGERCAEPLKEILRSCKNRVVIFNNKTKKKNKQAEQVNQLLSLVDLVVAENGGIPFSDQLFAELKEGASRRQGKEKAVESLEDLSEDQIVKLKTEIYKSYDDQLLRITAMVEQKLQQTTERLQRQLAEEQARLGRQLAEEQEARLEAEKKAQEAQLRSDDKIRELRESLERAKKEAEEFRKQAEGKMCAIL